MKKAYNFFALARIKNLALKFRSPKISSHGRTEKKIDRDRRSRHDSWIEARERALAAERKKKKREKKIVRGRGKERDEGRDEFVLGRILADRER